MRSHAIYDHEFVEGALNILKAFRKMLRTGAPPLPYEFCIEKIAIIEAARLAQTRTACEVPVKRLTLRIPVADTRAGFMHACGDEMRHNYAGVTPAGTGKVWDSSQGNKVKIVGTFYPYLWVGDGERGVCWFADADRDWILDDETPVIDLVREGETLWLNVHFITKPGSLEREHKIVFGRPLDASEVRLIYSTVKEWSKQTSCTDGVPQCR